ncbi:head-tail adaptor protein [Sphingomonas sp. R1]|uniref:phage head completion protein n=1 Tax=Sphingomonas sp. R1 TaxID=399176 RepID=UPI0022256A8B|nr:head-tail adaptor protein [Sphingomonas sp. R1]UYY77791.1 hypothetical protein OIM94_01935 [Sphingomonas sp. R1]
MLARGRRDTPIRFERADVTIGDMGTEDEPAWSEVARALASARYGSSAERRDGAASGAQQVATFRVDATATTRAVLPAHHRIVSALGNWNITGAVPVGRAETEFTAVLARG